MVLPTERKQTTESSPKCHFLFLQAIYNKILKVSVSQELYVIINRLTF